MSVESTLWSIILVKHEAVREFTQHYSVNSPITKLCEEAIVEPKLQAKLVNVHAKVKKQPQQSPNETSTNTSVASSSQQSDMSTLSTTSSILNSRPLAPASLDVENVHRNPNQPVIQQHQQVNPIPVQKPQQQSGAQTGTALSSHAQTSSETELAAARARLFALTQRTTGAQALQPPSAAAPSTSAPTASSITTKSQTTAPATDAPISSMDALKAKMAAIANNPSS
jgi:hypothetical protein